MALTVMGDVTEFFLFDAIKPSLIKSWWNMHRNFLLTISFIYLFIYTLIGQLIIIVRVQVLTLLNKTCTHKWKSLLKQLSILKNVYIPIENGASWMKWLIAMQMNLVQLSHTEIKHHTITQTHTRIG